MNEGLKSAIEDIRCLLEEAEESGDLEERLALNVKLADLLGVYLAHDRHGTEAKYLPCGLCNGEGKITEYSDSWPCQSCLGIGGNFR